MQVPLSLSCSVGGPVSVRRTPDVPKGSGLWAQALPSQSDEMPSTMVSTKGTRACPTALGPWDGHTGQRRGVFSCRISSGTESPGSQSFEEELTYPEGLGKGELIQNRQEATSQLM